MVDYPIEGSCGRGVKKLGKILPRQKTRAEADRGRLCTGMSSG